MKVYLALPDLLAQPGLALHHLSSGHALIASKLAAALTDVGHLPQQVHQLPPPHILQHILRHTGGPELVLEGGNLEAAQVGGGARQLAFLLLGGLVAHALQALLARVTGSVTDGVTGIPTGIITGIVTRHVTDGVTGRLRDFSWRRDTSCSVATLL